MFSPMLRTSTVTHDDRPISLVGDPSAGLIVVAGYQTSSEEVLGVLVAVRDGAELVFRLPRETGHFADVDEAVRHVVARSEAR